MASTTPSVAPAPRVPAWKRIGLKLKYANDTVEGHASTSTFTPTSTSSSSIPTTAARSQPPVAVQHHHSYSFAGQHHPNKRPLDPTASETPVKRSKLALLEAYGSKAQALRREIQHSTSGTAHQLERSSLPAPTGLFKAPNQAPKRIVFDDNDEPSDAAYPPSAQINRSGQSSLRKSVSFTPDTKQRDGESTQHLLKSWAAGKNPAEVSETGKPTVQSSPPSKESKAAREPKKEKKLKKLKQAKKPADEDKSTDDAEDKIRKITPNYVTYLEQYYSDRDHWKFNKNRQNDLFKNLFNVFRIPSKHDPAIVQYISGLQGQARQRIAEQAEEVLKAIWVNENPDIDPMSLDSPSAQRVAYYTALQRSIERYESSGAGRSQYADEKLKQILREHEKGRRAEAILRQALGDELYPESTAARRASNVTAATASANSRATKALETTRENGQDTTTSDANLTGNMGEAKPKRKRKARTEKSSSSESTSSSSSESDSSSSEDEGNQHSTSTSPPPARKPHKRNPAPPQQAAALGSFFDTALLDEKFGTSAPPHLNTKVEHPRRTEHAQAIRPDESDDDDDDDDSDSDSD